MVLSKPDFSSYGDEPPKVFISYAREDEKYARKLFDDLSALKLDVWMDKMSLLPGEEWESAIEREIQESDFFIALLSRKSVEKRGFFQNELKKALDVYKSIPPNQIYFVPARLDNCELAYPGIRRFNWIDMLPDWEAAIDSIILSIDTKSGRPSPSEEKATRVSFILTKRTESTLQALIESMGADSEEEVFRRALQVYELLLREEGEGAEVLIRNPDDGRSVQLLVS